MGDVEIGIHTTADVSGAQATAKAIDKVTESTAKLADENERYQATLERMSARAGLAAPAAAGQDADSELTEKSIRLQKELSDRKEQAAQADKDIADGVVKVGEADVKAAGESIKATERTLLSKQQLKEGIKGLAIQFPTVAAAARLALNPITLVVGAIAGAFSLFKYRVDELTRSLAGLEMPDLSESQVGRVRQAADAWKSYNDALQGVLKSYNSVEEASNRTAKRLDAELEQKKKLLAAEKGLELSRLEANKGSMSADAYERSKLEIEDRYARSGLKVDENARQAELAEKARKAANLAASAEAKTREAAGIRVGDEEREGRVLEKSKAAAEAAEKDMKERRERLGQLADYRGGEMGFARRQAFGFQYRARYDAIPLNEAEDLERGGIASDQAIIDNYNAQLAKRQQRADLRQRRSTLQAEAGREMGQAMTINSELPGDVAGFARESAVDRSVANTESLTRARGAAVEAQGKVEQLSREIQTAVESGKGVSAATLQKLQEWSRWQREMEQRILSLEGGRRMTGGPST